MLEVVEIGGLASEEIVGDGDVVSLLDQVIDEVASDESGASGNEHVHGS